MNSNSSCAWPCFSWFAVDPTASRHPAHTTTTLTLGNVLSMQRRGPAGQVTPTPKTIGPEVSPADKPANQGIPQGFHPNERKPGGLWWESWDMSEEKPRWPCLVPHGGSQQQRMEVTSGTERNRGAAIPVVWSPWFQVSLRSKYTFPRLARCPSVLLVNKSLLA